MPKCVEPSPGKTSRRRLDEETLACDRWRVILTTSARKIQSVLLSAGALTFSPVRLITAPVVGDTGDNPDCQPAARPDTLLEVVSTPFE